MVWSFILGSLYFGFVLAPKELDVYSFNPNADALRRSAMLLTTIQDGAPDGARTFGTR